MVTSVALLSALLPGAAGWATCDFPNVDWLVVDSGVGKSATQKVTTLGSTTFIGGYAGGETTLKSSSSSTTITNTESDWLSPCSYGCSQTGEMDMHISKIGDDGTPQAIWIFEGSGLGSAPGWSMMHGMEDGTHLALALAIRGNLTLPSGATSGSAGALIQNTGASGSTAVVIKMRSDGTIPWYVAFSSAAGSSVSSVDGDYQGNMFVNLQTCVPCTSNCVPGVDGYGRPTGQNAPTCTRYLTKLNAADGSEAWKKTIPDAINPGYFRLQRRSGAAVRMYAWGSVEGADITLDACTLTSAAGGTKSQSVIFEIDATNGAFNWCAAPTGDTAVSRGYIDLSTSRSSPVLVVQGGFSGTVAFGSTTLTASHGYYTSFVARLSTTDGSVVWAEQTPMSRGVQVTPDGAYVGVFCQTTGTTDSVALTDTGGATTTVRSRGSWDLIAMKLDATDGTGIYAMDGGGDSMEYFHGFGMNSDGDMLISGYSRSSTFHFGDHSLPNTQSASNGGAGDNKIFTIQVSATSSTPSCVTSCASNTPVIATTSCFIDNYCYADSTVAPYPARECFKCDAATSQTDWTGPDLTAHCFITGYSDGGVCYAEGASKPGSSSRSPPSACMACLTDKATDAWSVREGYDLASGSCVALATISTTTTDALTTAMTASAVVKSITGANGLGTSFAAAKTLYVGSVLQTLAKTAWTGADYTMGNTYFGSATWLDDYVLSALDGTGQFGGTLAAARGEMTAARTEAVKKALQDQILVMATLSSVAADYNVEANWDLAYAYYYGNDPSGAPFARANKRGANYGTMAADGSTAKLNFKVLEAIAEGKAACTGGTDEAGESTGAADTTATLAAWTKLRGAVYGIYYQAALRYAYKLDVDIAGGTATSEHQGEGGAFWRVVAPLMHSRDAKLTAYVNDFYSMTNTPSGANNKYCPLLYLLSQNMIDDFGAADMGSLTAASAIACVGGIQLPSTISDPLSTAMSASAEVKVVTGADNFTHSKSLYVGGPMQTLARKAFSCAGSTCYYSKAVAYFGSTTWLDDYVLSALDGTGQFAGTIATARGNMDAAREEAIKKALQDQIMVNAAMGSLNDPTSAASWYAFYAYWTGDDPSGAPWARANKRCKNYGTCGGNSTGGSGEKAQVNTEILLATLSALENPATKGADAKTDAVNNVLIVYYQAALRYAYLLDSDITAGTATADHQGEGGAFWRVIAPLMHEHDADTSKYVSNFYNMTTVPAGGGRYCPLAYMLYTNLPGAPDDDHDDHAGHDHGDAGNATSHDDHDDDHEQPSMGTLQGSSVTLPSCPAPITASTPDAQKTALVIVAPGEVADYPTPPIAAKTAETLGVLPQAVTVTVAASARRRLQAAAGNVTITITVFYATDAEAAAMETAMTNMAGTATTASSFLTAALGRAVTVTTNPTPPVSGNAVDPPAPPSPPPPGLETGALVGIIVGAVVGVSIVGVVVYCLMKPKSPKIVSATKAGAWREGE